MAAGGKEATRFPPGEEFVPGMVPKREWTRRVRTVHPEVIFEFHLSIPCVPSDGDRPRIASVQQHRWGHSCRRETARCHQKMLGDERLLKPADRRASADPTPGKSVPGTGGRVLPDAASAAEYVPRPVHPPAAQAVSAPSSELPSCKPRDRVLHRAFAEEFQIWQRLRGQRSLRASWDESRSLRSTAVTAPNGQSSLCNLHVFSRNDTAGTRPRESAPSTSKGMAYSSNTSE